jgi:hypothetical protein
MTKPLSRDAHPTQLGVPSKATAPPPVLPNRLLV